MNNFSAREIAFSAVMTAVLIGGQYIFSFVYGLEIVTLLFACFAYTFGARAGIMTATAFSLLRCFLFGFFPNVIILYLVYYNLFAIVVASLKRVKGDRSIFSVTLIISLFFCICCVLLIIFPPKVSILYKNSLMAFIGVLLGLFIILIAALILLPVIFKERGREMRKLLFITAVCCLCTVSFTLLDDVISPLVFGYTKDAAYAYFITSFTAMLPQTVCTFATVSVLFYPITKIFSMFAKSFEKK